MAAKRVQIAQAGEYLGHWQRPYVLTTDDLARMASNHVRDVVIDYEHASEFGNEAPAAGWVLSLTVEGDVLWGDVSWTDRASGMIDAGEYRYLSPVIDFDAVDRQSGNPIGAHLRSVGLTNTPFMTLQPVANRAAAPAKGALTTTPMLSRQALLNQAGRTDSTPSHQPDTTVNEQFRAFLNRLGQSLGRGPLNDELTALDETRGVVANAARVPDLEAQVTTLTQERDTARTALAAAQAAVATFEAQADEALLNSAVADFTIPAAERDDYAGKLKTDRAGTRALLNALPKGAHKPAGGKPVTAPDAQRPGAVANSDKPQTMSAYIADKRKGA